MPKARRVDAVAGTSPPYWGGFGEEYRTRHFLIEESFLICACCLTVRDLMSSKGDRLARPSRLKRSEQTVSKHLQCIPKHGNTLVG